MRRTTTVIVTLLLALAAMAAPAMAMQPPGEPAQDLFGCPNPVAGHPGAAGLVDATPLVEGKKGGLTDKTPDHADGAASARPTAWAAVDNADPIELGECS